MSVMEPSVPEVSSTKPYLVRAIYEWCSDNGFTPYVAVAVNAQTRVPEAHVRNNEIVLNISTLATHKLQITNSEISFTARFSGMAQEIYIPIEQVVAIYAKETGHGMAFDVPKPVADPAGSSLDTHAVLHSVTQNTAKPAGGARRSSRRPPVGLAPATELSDSGGHEDPPPKPPTKGASTSGRPALRRIK